MCHVHVPSHTYLLTRTFSHVPSHTYLLTRTFSHVPSHMQGEMGPRGIAIALRHTTQGGSQESHRAFRVTLRTAKISQSGKKAILTNSTNDVIPSSSSEFGPCDSNKCAELVKGKVPGVFVGTVQKCSMHRCRETTTSTAMVLVEVNIGAGSFRLINTTYFVAENKVPKGVVFTVERVGGSTGAKEVTYSTISEGVDGVSVGGTPGTFHTYMHVCVYVCIYIYIHTHTHSHVAGMMLVHIHTRCGLQTTFELDYLHTYIHTHTHHYTTSGRLSRGD
jgi:hypothetical protein